MSQCTFRTIAGTVALLTAVMAMMPPCTCRALTIVTVEYPEEEQTDPHSGTGWSSLARWTSTNTHCHASAWDGSTWSSATGGAIVPSLSCPCKYMYPIDACGSEKLEYEVSGSSCGHICGDAESGSGTGTASASCDGYVWGLAEWRENGQMQEYEEEVTWSLSESLDESEYPPGNTFYIDTMGNESYVGFEISGTAMSTDQAVVCVLHYSDAVAQIQGDAPSAYGQVNTYADCSLSLSE